MIIFLKKRLLPLGLACLMFLLSAPVSAQSTDTDMVEVTGVVTEASSGLPMAGVKVQAYNIARHSAMTKADGSFEIEVAKAGTYYLQANFIGYETITVRDIAVRNIAAGTDDTAYPLTAIAMHNAPSTVIERPCTK